MVIRTTEIIDNNLDLFAKEVVRNFTEIYSDSNYKVIPDSGRINRSENFADNFCTIDFSFDKYDHHGINGYSTTIGFVYFDTTPNSIKLLQHGTDKEKLRMYEEKISQLLNNFQAIVREKNINKILKNSINGE